MLIFVIQYIIIDDIGGVVFKEGSICKGKN